MLFVRVMAFSLLILFFLLIDYYFFQAVLVATKNVSSTWKIVLRWGFWLPTALCVLVLIWWMVDYPYRTNNTMFRAWALTTISVLYISKIIALLFLVIDDVQRLFHLTLSVFTKKNSPAQQGEIISRSEFLSKAALLTTTVPIATFAYGIISGAHDYQVRRLSLALPRLPASFDGLRIAQISDIHTGSFWNKTAVKGGVEMLLNEKPDMIFFTGDLVNNQTNEVDEYITVFNKLRAPLGVFSVTGNHDYGDYKSWKFKADKLKNFQDFLIAHQSLGFNLLLNENKIITQGADQLAIIGVENWGTRFSQHGDINKACKGINQAAVKLLLSHDPTHWDAQVRPMQNDIDVMFAGHTHGAQFGVSIGDSTWTPAKYIYKQWGGLYKESNQYLYVNRGFGYIGYPGRVGMPPEITILELKRAES